MLSVPPASTTSATPVCTIMAALTIASSPDAQRRSTSHPGTSIGNPAFRAHNRPMAGSSPLEYPWPRITSSIFSGSRPVCSKTASMTLVPSSAAGKSFNEPPKRPTAVRKGVDNGDVSHEISPFREASY